MRKAPLVAIEIVVGRPGLGHSALGKVDDPGGQVGFGEGHGQAREHGGQAIEAAIQFPHAALKGLGRAVRQARHDRNDDRTESSVPQKNGGECP